MLTCSHKMVYCKYVHAREILKLTHAIEERFGTLGKSQCRDIVSADIELELETFLTVGISTQGSRHVTILCISVQALLFRSQ